VGKAKKVARIHCMPKLLTTRGRVAPEFDHAFAIGQVFHGDTLNFFGLSHDRRHALNRAGVTWEDSMNKLWRATLSHHVGWGALIVLCSLIVAGCAQPEVIDMTSFDPSQDQTAIVGYYRGQAMDLREKAAALAESVVRYERLFGPQSDWVSGAQQLSQYYAAAAQDLERQAEAHAEVARTGRQRRQ
jgi:hypothetical protein